jgi:hypothetical protein
MRDRISYVRLKKIRKKAILAILLVGAFFFYSLDKQNLNLYLISAYSRFTEGSVVEIGDLKFELQDPWYIKKRDVNAVKIFRLPDFHGNYIVGIVELMSPAETRNEINNKNLTKLKRGIYEGYKIEVAMKCSDGNTQCRHMVLVIPKINSKITISNFLENQSNVVSEILDVILGA